MTRFLRLPPFTPPRSLTALSILLFFASLPTPACYTDANCYYGFQLLLGGCFCGFLAYPAALANPLLVVAWRLTFFFPIRRRAPLICAFVALCLSFVFLFNNTLLLDEAGHEASITARGPGYWLWVASAACALIAAIQNYKSQSPLPTTPTR